MDNVITVPHNFTPRDYQLELFKAMDGVAGHPETRIRRAILRWHRRAGKDKCCWNYMIKEAVQVAGNYFYIFPEKTMARRALWENVDDSGFKLLDHLPSQFIKGINNQEMLITLTNNSTIRVIGYDKNPDSIRGVACKGAVFSEFAFMDPESYKTLIPAIRQSKGWCIFNSTPQGRNHFFEMWEKVEKNQKWFSSLLQTMWPARPGYSGLVSEEELEEIQETEGYTVDDMEREFGSAFSAGLKGAYYIDCIEKAYEEKRISDFVYDEAVKVDTYWDLGVDDATAVWFTQTIGNKTIFIDYYEESGKDLQHYVRMLDRKGYEYGMHFLPHDSKQRSIQTGTSTVDMFDEMLRLGRVSGDVHTLERTRVQDGINAVRAKFSRYHFDKDKCSDGLRKLELYHKKFDKVRGVFMKDPVHDYTSHAADALRMEALATDVHRGPRPDILSGFIVSDFDVFD